MPGIVKEQIHLTAFLTHHLPLIATQVSHFTSGIWRMHSNTAAAAKSLQSCPTLCDPIDGSPPGSSVPRILQARILEWVAISFSTEIPLFLGTSKFV